MANNLESLGNSLCVIISREEVDALDIDPALSMLQRLVESPDTARENMERWDIGFHGYNDNTEELFEISAVREYVHLLDEQFPFWLFSLANACWVCSAWRIATFFHSLQKPQKQKDIRSN